MKSRSLAFLMIAMTLIMPSAHGSRLPLGTAVEGEVLRKELIANGFRCSTLVKESKLICTKFNKKLIVDIQLIGGKWPTKGVVSSLVVTSKEISGRVWLTKLAIIFFAERQDPGPVDTDGWVKSACAGDEPSDLYENQTWGNNFTITPNGNICSMRIWGYRT